MINRKSIYGVILAGGNGSRLWPLSRELYPKQLLKLNQENTLFQSTFLRLSALIPPSNILTVTNIKHTSDVKLQLLDLQKDFNEINPFKVISEPVGRNTAPAIALSIYYVKELLENDVDPVILIAPSDHLIKDIDKSTKTFKDGIKLAENGYIVTFGITPDKPDTGYGYIDTTKTSALSSISSNALSVKEFKEKPNYETAKKYCEAGSYYWNGGIFMFKASTMLEELNKFAPEIIESIEKSKLSNSSPSINFDDYENQPNISIDYAVMEKSDKIVLIPFDCGWNDMGSWEAIYDIAKKDDESNFITGNVIDYGSKNSLIYSTSKLVTTIGLENIVLVETEDAILACDKNKTQDVKKIFETLKEKEDPACNIHKTVYRPWGFYTVMQKGKGFLTKTIQVNSGAKLTLQLHHHRSEHWVVLEGKALVVKGDKEYILNAGESIDIAVEEKHSLQNPYDEDLKILEVQKGEILLESDIVRLEDVYGRA